MGFFVLLPNCKAFGFLSILPSVLYLQVRLVFGWYCVEGTWLFYACYFYWQWWNYYIDIFLFIATKSNYWKEIKTCFVLPSYPFNSYKIDTTFDTPHPSMKLTFFLNTFLVKDAIDWWFKRFTFHSHSDSLTSFKLNECFFHCFNHKTFATWWPAKNSFQWLNFRTLNTNSGRMNCFKLK